MKPASEASYKSWFEDMLTSLCLDKGKSIYRWKHLTNEDTKWDLKKNWLTDWGSYYGLID